MLTSSTLAHGRHSVQSPGPDRSVALRMQWAIVCVVAAEVGALKWEQVGQEVEK